MNPTDQTWMSLPSGEDVLPLSEASMGRPLPRALSSTELASLVGIVRRRLDRVIRGAHEQALEALADDAEMWRSSKAVRLSVYRSLRTLRTEEARLRADTVGRATVRVATALALQADAGCVTGSFCAGEEDLEQEILCGTFVAQADALARPALVSMARALGAADALAIDALCAAIGPRMLLDVYLSAAAALGLDAEVRLAMLRALHAWMVSDLPDAYRECLHAIGIAAPALRRDAAPFDSQGLLTVLHLLAGRAPTENAEELCWSREHVTRALYLLQASQRTMLTAPGQATSGLAAQVEAQMRVASVLHGQTRSLSHNDRAVAELVETLFEMLIADPGFPAHLTQDLLKLRVPLLRLALESRQLLLDRESPARRLLEALVRTGAEFPPTSPHGAAMLACCRAAIRGVLVHYDHDAAVFGDILEAFERSSQRIRSSVP